MVPNAIAEGLILSAGSEKQTLIGTTKVVIFPGCELSVIF